jgi:hypothetical protein
VPQSASPPPAATSTLYGASTCTDWQNASAADNQTYADAQGGSINGTDVFQYLTSTCTDFLNNTSNDPQIGDIVNYMRNGSDTSTTLPCDNEASSTLPSC